MGKIGFTSRVCIARVISLLCHKFNTVNKSGLRLQRQLAVALGAKHVAQAPAQSLLCH